MDKTAIETGDSVMKDEGENAIPVEMGSVNDSLPEGDAGVSSSATASTEKLPVEDAKQLSTDKATDAPVASVKEASNNEDTNDRAGKSSEILDFTNRKVVIHNILKFEQVKDVKKMINKWFRELEDPESIKVTRIKKPPVGNFAQLTLETEAMVEPFMNLINNGRMTNKKGKLLFAKREDSKSDRNDATNEQGSKRDRNDEDDNGDSRKRRKKESSLPKTSDEIRDAITPLWKMPYEQQLQMKWREMVKKCTMKICQEIKAKFR
jgi:tRNA (uracil-5-)-methyltransferase